jgi:hypothetical protein
MPKCFFRVPGFVFNNNSDLLIIPPTRPDAAPPKILVTGNQKTTTPSVGHNAPNELVRQKFSFFDLYAVFILEK